MCVALQMKSRPERCLDSVASRNSCFIHPVFIQNEDISLCLQSIWRPLQSITSPGEMRSRYSRRQIKCVGHRKGYHTVLETVHMHRSQVDNIVLECPYASLTIWSLTSPSKGPKMHRSQIRKSHRSRNARIHRLQNGPSYHIQMALMHRHQVVQIASPHENFQWFVDEMPIRVAHEGQKKSIAHKISTNEVRDMSHSNVHELCSSYRKKVHQCRTCATHHSLTRKSILMITHNLVGYSIEFCNNTLGLQWLRLDRHQSIPNAATRIILWVPKYSHITISIRHDFIGSQFRSVIEIRLFTQNWPGRHRPGIPPETPCRSVPNTARRSLRAASQGYLARSRYECNTISMAHLPCVGKIIENFMSQEVRQPTANAEQVERRSKTNHRQAEQFKRKWKHAQIILRIQIECRSKRTISPIT